MDYLRSGWVALQIDFGWYLNTDNNKLIDEHVTSGGSSKSAPRSKLKSLFARLCPCASRPVQSHDKREII